MKALIWLLTAVNLYFGSNAGLNALGVLRSSKFSKGATIVYAIVFLGMGLFGAYTAWTSNNLKLGLAVALGPWVVLIAVMALALVTNSWQ